MSPGSILCHANQANMKLTLDFLIEKVYLMMNWIGICGSRHELILNGQEICHLPPSPDRVMLYCDDIMAQLFSPNTFSANKFCLNTWRLVTHRLFFRF